MAFIPVDKMKVLRENAAKGDERAKKIINAHFQKKDYSADLEEYFKPAQEPAQAPVSMPAVEPGPMPENVGTGNPKLDEFLRGNGIKEGDPEYEDAVEDYYAEFPQERPQGSDHTMKPTAKLDGLKDYNSEEAHLPNPNDIDVKEEVDMAKDIASKIIETIQSCDHISLVLVQNDDIDDTTRKGAMSTLSEIKQLLFDAADKVKKIKQTLCKNCEDNL